MLKKEIYFFILDVYIAPTVNTWLEPVQTETLVGWLVIAGAVFTVSRAELDVVLPHCVEAIQR